MSESTLEKLRPNLIDAGDKESPRNILIVRKNREEAMETFLDYKEVFLGNAIVWEDRLTLQLNSGREIRFVTIADISGDKMRQIFALAGLILI